jgi:quercetin dioxygenase-like cupin family protein
MKTLVLTASLFAGLAAALVAQGAAMPTYMVPATREPHHTVKLENQYVRVLDVTVPPYDSTLYHIHENPYVYVSIGAATLKAQVEGSADITDLNLKDGEVRFSPAVTHRVGNIATTPFRNITIQIQGRDDSTFQVVPQLRTSAQGASVAFENELIRVDRLQIAPGQSTSMHAHPRSHLLVAVHGGSVKMESGPIPVTQAMKSGDFDWHTGGYAHNITNVGATAFEAIEVVWK